MNVNNILKKSMVLLIAILGSVNVFGNTYYNWGNNYTWTDPETGLIYCVCYTVDYYGAWSDWIHTPFAWVSGLDPELAVSHPNLRSYITSFPLNPHKEEILDGGPLPVMPMISSQFYEGDPSLPLEQIHTRFGPDFKSSKLKEFVIPESITHIAADFSMENLTKLEFPKHLEYCYVQLINCDKLESLEFGDETGTLPNDFFISVSSSKLSSFIVPKGIRFLVRADENPLRTGLSWPAGFAKKNNCEHFEPTCYLKCPALKTITLPQLYGKDYDEMENTIKSIENVYFHDDVTKIIPGQFSGWENLKNVTFPNSLREIGEHAFSSCNNLKTLQFPSSLKRIGDYAFNLCEGLTDITIPYGIDTIHQRSFSACHNVQTIRIPKTIKHIDNFSFAGCGYEEGDSETKLTDIYVHWEKPIEEDPEIFSFVPLNVYLNTDVIVKNSPIYANTTLNIVDDNLWDVAAPSRYLYRRTSPWKYFKHKKYSGGGGTIWSFRNTIGAVGNGTVCYDHYVMKEENGSTTETAITNEICNDTVEVTSQTCWIPMEEELTFKMEEGDSIVSVLVNGQEMKDKVVFDSKIGSYKFYKLTITGITSAYTIYVKFSGYESGTEPQTDDVTLKAKSYTREYGEANPTFGYEVTEGTITSGTPTITCAATQTSPVGTYDIVINEGSVSNGTVNLVNGKLIITKAPLTISAGNYRKQEGEANPTFTPTFSGFKNNETKSVLTTQPTITTTATTSSPAGTYPVTVSGAAAQNYDISYVNGTLTVTAKPVDNANTFEPDYFWPDMSENVDKIEFIVIGFPKELGHFSADELKLLDNEGTQVRTLKARWLDDGEYVEGAPFYNADKDIYQFVKFVFSSENTAAVKATGIYQFTVPEGYVWNDKYNDSDDDKGISAGARYNPEFTITYHVNEDVPVVKENIEFANAKVKEICIANWDKNNDGELSKEEAAMVTSLANKFNYNKEITSFDELQYFTGLSSIGRDFYECKNLRSVTLPTSLTSISTAGFSFCESLRKIHIPEKVNSIGFNPFSGCTNLEEMTVATNNPYFDSRNGCNAIIKKDNNELISGCKTSVIPEGIVNINCGAFMYISTLTSINIPASVKCISYADGWHGDDGSNPFIYCSGLTSITVADGNPVYDSRDNCNAVIETATNTLRVGCKATMIPNTVKIIGSMAFEGSGVTRVDIPNSIEEVKSAAFMDCKSLTEVTLSSSINMIGQFAFGECTNLQKVTSNIFDPFELDNLTFSPKVPVLYVPKGRKAAYEAAGWAQYFSKIIEMDEDGIDEMDNGQWTMDNVVIYNLSGQRLSKPQRGVNIINGKKVLIK